MQFDANSFNKEAIANSVKNNSASFNGGEIMNLSTCVNKTKLNFTSQLKKYKDQLLILSAKGQKLISHKNIPEIQAQIKKEKENLQKINNELKNSLNDLAKKGMYLCIIDGLNPSAYSNKELQDMAISYIFPQAIEQINGSYLSSVQTLYKNESIENYFAQIKESISGEMSVDVDAFTKRAKGNTQWIYLAVVNVMPLKKSSKQNMSSASAPSGNFKVLNVLKDNDMSKLRSRDASLNLSNEVIEELTNKINYYKENISTNNDITEQQSSEAIGNAAAQIKKINLNLYDLNAEYDKKINALRSTLSEVSPNIILNESQPNKSIDEAIQNIHQQMQAVKNDYIKESENELILQTFNVVGEDVPANNIANNVLEKIKAMNSAYGKVDAFENIKELTKSEINNKTSETYSNTTQTGINYFRKVDKVFLYVQYGENGEAKVNMVGKFKIEESKKVSNNDANKNEDERFGTAKIGGRTYKIVKIGSQIWMAENLNYDVEGSYCYGDKKENCDKYGKLYTWDAAMLADKEIDGWHLPTDAEWTILSNYLGGKGVAGGKMKVGGVSGFEALLGGNQDSDGSSHLMGNGASFWSSSPDGSGRAWDRGIYSSNANLYHSYSYTSSRFSVRLLKD